MTPVTKQTLVHDHGYTNREETIVSAEKTPPPVKEKAAKPRKPKHSRKFQELQNLYDYNAEIRKSSRPVVHDVTFKERAMSDEMSLLYEFLTKGIDSEDIQYMRQCYEGLLADDAVGYWLNDTHWVDHCVTDLYSSPPKRRKKDDHRVHSTGCARTEGYYKIEATEKAKYKYHHARSTANTSPNAPVQKMQGKIFYLCCNLVKLYHKLM